MRVAASKPETLTRPRQSWNSAGDTFYRWGFGLRQAYGAAIDFKVSLTPAAFSLCAPAHDRLALRAELVGNLRSRGRCIDFLKAESREFLLKQDGQPGAGHLVAKLPLANSRLGNSKRFGQSALR